jgi:hypothetical protein
MIVHSRNTAKHSAMGFKPFEIIYARKPAASSSLTDETHITSEFVARQLQARQHIEASAKLRMDREKATRRRDYEKTHRVSTEEFKDGDLVLISNEATHSDSTKKLEPKYIGPMRVVQARTQECVVESKSDTGHLEYKDSVLKCYTYRRKFILDFPHIMGLNFMEFSRRFIVDRSSRIKFRSNPDTHVIRIIQKFSSVI